MSGRSDVWICPAAMESMKENGNTYAVLVSRAMNNYRRDRLPLHKQRLKAYIWDNYDAEVGMSGWLPGGAFASRSYWIDDEQRFYPHKFNTSGGRLSGHASSEGTNGLFLDGHVSLRAKP